MSTLNLKITGMKFDVITEVDGKKVEFKNNEFGNRVAVIDTESTSVNLSIYTQKHELTEKHWLIASLLFFVISIFGIFDRRYGRRFYKLAYSGILNFSDGETVVLNLKSFSKGGTAIECASLGFDNNATNIYEFDSVAKKRARMLTVIKLVTWAAVIIAVVLILVL